MHSQHLSLFNNLVTRTSQLRSLVSLVAKFHIFKVLERERSINFPIDQTYFNNLFSAIQDRNAKFKARFEDSKTYRDDILEAVEHVVSVNTPTLVHCRLGKTQMFKFTGDMAARMVTNLEIHIRMRFEHSVHIWLKNQFRILMTKEEYEDQRKSMTSYFEDLKNYPEYFPFFERYEKYKQQIRTLGDPDDEKCKIDIKPYIISMWEMRRECEIAGRSSNRSMKEISVIPQASFRAVFMLVDTTALSFLKAFKSSKKTRKAKEFATLENQEATWQYFFKMNELRKLSKRPFSWSISTDGVTASVRFLKFVKKYTISKKRKNGQQLPSLLRKGFHSESTILEDFQGHEENVNFYSVDPGVRSVLTIHGIREDKCVYELKQKTYRHGMGLNDIPHRKRYVKEQVEKFGMVKFRKQQREQQKQAKRKQVSKRNPIPFQKSVLLDSLKVLVSTVKSQWKELWPLQQNGQLQKAKRRRRFRKKNKHRQFMDATIKNIKEKITTEGKTSVILFGNGGQSGGFKCRGGGIKGPVLGLKRRLAQEFPVICCSEFRTSKLCSECGQVLDHPKRWNAATVFRTSVNGVSFCHNTDHKHRTLNRDADAARKIGYRFLMQLFKQDIGPWKYGSTCTSSWKGMSEFSKQYLSQMHPRSEGFGLVTRAMDSSHKTIVFEKDAPRKKGRLSEN